MEYIILIFVFFIGASLTSFFMVLIHRNFDRSALISNSVCDNCGHKLSLLEVFPVFSFLFHKGQCKHCGYKIPINYLAMELLGGIILAISYNFSDYSVISYLILITSYSVLFLLSLYDMRNNLVIDRVWIIGFILLLVVRIYESTVFIYLLSATVMFLSLYLLAIVTEKIFKKETLGGGDIKLYLFIGMVLDLRLALLSLFLASVFGLIYAMIKKSKSDTYLPLVPFISLGVFVSYFWGNDLINWYLSLLGI